MPRLNSQAQATIGYAVSWYDDARTIFQDSVNEHYFIRLSDGTLIADRGANDIFANNQHWIAWLGGYGVFSSRGGDPIPKAWVGRPTNELVAPDGAFAIKVDYQSFGPWQVLEPDGRDWELTAGDAIDVQLLGNRQAVWTQMPDALLRATPGPNIELPKRPIWFPRVKLLKDGSYGLLYQDQATSTLVLNGHVIKPSGDYFRPDFMQLPDGSFYIVWASNEGEPDAVALRLTRAQLNVSPLITDYEPPIIVPVVGKPCWLGWFCFDMSKIAALPGNAVLDVQTSLVHRVSDWKPIAQYTSAEETPGNEGLSPEQVIAKARRQRSDLPVFYYWTRGQWDTVPSADWVGVEAYCHANETLADFERVVRIQCKRAPYCVPIIQCYTSNDNQTKDLRSLVPVYGRIVRDEPTVHGLFAFSGSGRATGYQDHPEVRDLYIQLMNGITGEPAEVPLPKPPVTPKPQPQPPKPQPVLSPYTQLTQLGGHMEPVRVGLAGSAGKFGRPLTNAKPDGFGGYPWVFDGDNSDGQFEWEMTKPDDAFCFRHVQSNVIFSVDRTQYSPSLEKQYATRPQDKRQAFESPQVYESPEGDLLVMVRYTNAAGVAYYSSPLTVVKK